MQVNYLVVMEMSWKLIYFAKRQKIRHFFVWMSLLPSYFKGFFLLKHYDCIEGQYIIGIQNNR